MSTAHQSMELPESEDAAHSEHDQQLHLRVVQDMIARPDVYDDIPNGCLLILIPDNDAEQAEWAIRQSARRARQGRNVYLRRVVVAELPPLPEPNLSANHGLKRTFYNPDGSIRSVEIGREDGTWIPIETEFGEPPLSSIEDPVGGAS